MFEFSVQLVKLEMSESHRNRAGIGDNNDWMNFYDHVVEC